jgi:hypothetical protein
LTKEEILFPKKKKMPRKFTNHNASSFEKFPLWLHDKILKEKQ